DALLRADHAYAEAAFEQAVERATPALQRFRREPLEYLAGEIDLVDDHGLVRELQQATHDDDRRARLDREHARSLLPSLCPPAVQRYALRRRQIAINRNQTKKAEQRTRVIVRS